ncbi:MAG: hypothetical protein IPG55_07455 [Saprospiraceae bacterium]|nr:hypothetical protein [Candidatus Defluviibacterium haderslevense]MBK7245920.1 hypothetical protein [Candidatus Defluviibacterium haderslevense]
MELESEIKYKLSLWMKSKYSEEEVLLRLNEFPLSEFQKTEIFKSYKQGIHQIRTRVGFIYLGIGGVLGFVSCVFSMIIADHFWNSFFLYGGTSVAIVLAFIGFYFIFE